MRSSFLLLLFKAAASGRIESLDGFRVFYSLFHGDAADKAGDLDSPLIDSYSVGLRTNPMVELLLELDYLVRAISG